MMVIKARPILFAFNAGFVGCCALCGRSNPQYLLRLEIRAAFGSVIEIQLTRLQFTVLCRRDFDMMIIES